MSWAAWLTVVVVCALGAATPGPSLAVVVAHALGGSRRRGVACAWAHALGVGTYALATLAGLAALLRAHPRLFTAITALGALYLAWLGVGLLRTSAARASMAPTGETAAIGPVRDGLTMALLNPKTALFFAAVFSQFVGPEPGWLEGAMLCLTAMAVDGLYYSLVAGVLTSGPGLGWLRRQGQRLDRLMGLVLLGVAAWAALRLAAGPV
jgi:threonine/homoserine/homoserine lactone efflux protein